MPYLIPNTSSPEEAAMVAAENAIRVPLTEAGKFEMMAFTRAAMDALARCHHSDDITRSLVWPKIGKAERRFGLGSRRKSRGSAASVDETSHYRCEG